MQYFTDTSIIEQKICDTPTYKVLSIVTDGSEILLRLTELKAVVAAMEEEEFHREEIGRPREFMGPQQDHQSFPRNTKFYAEWKD